MHDGRVFNGFGLGDFLPCRPLKLGVIGERLIGFLVRRNGAREWSFLSKSG